MYLAGSVTVSGGMLKGNVVYVDNDFVDGSTGLTSTTVTVTGSSAKLEATNSLIVGLSTNGPATLNLDQGAQGNTGNINLGAAGTGASGSLTIKGGAAPSARRRGR